MAPTPGPGEVRGVSEARAGSIESVVFDLGGVLLDWNPRHLYRKLFPGDEPGMERFLARICTPAWNTELDRGQPFAEAIAQRQAEYPEWAGQIAAYRARWIEMIAGCFEETVKLLAELRSGGVPIYALSNWSAETYPEARAQFDFLGWFRGVLISGEVGLAKPDPAIYRLLCDRFDLAPTATLFVDDSAPNTEAARDLGFQVEVFQGAAPLRTRLVSAGLLGS